MNIWLQQKHMPSINNIGAHNSTWKDYELSFKIKSHMKKMNGVFNFRKLTVALYCAACWIHASKLQCHTKHHLQIQIQDTDKHCKKKQIQNLCFWNDFVEFQRNDPCPRFCGFPGLFSSLSDSEQHVMLSEKIYNMQAK